MKFGFIPLNDKVVIERVTSADKTPGGIILPENAKEKPKEGIVQAIGTGKLLDNGERTVMQVKVGDRVLFSSYAGNEFKLNNKEYIIMDEHEIFGVIN